MHNAIITQLKMDTMEFLPRSMAQAEWVGTLVVMETLALAVVARVGCLERWVVAQVECQVGARQDVVALA